jgi:hypothetical protein
MGRFDYRKSFCLLTGNFLKGRHLLIGPPKYMPALGATAAINRDARTAFK